MAEDLPPGRRLTLKRRGLIAGAAVAGLGALIAAEAASSAGVIGQPLSGGATLSTEVKLRHLLRRAGFGAGPAELEQYRRLGLPGTVDRLIDFEAVDNSLLDARLNRYHLDLSKGPDLQRWWTLRMIYSARPLEEKMTLFWHGLLTSAVSKVGRPEPMYVQNQFFRANALGSFPEILKGISKDPAMMIWLDLETNRKGHANENYARELMELFSMGVGNYTEQDVRESARAFTGWVVRRRKLPLGTFDFESLFIPRLHDDGSKTFLGQTGSFTGDDIIDIIVKHPASARFITRKLFSFFAYPNPSDDVLKPFVDAYTASNSSIKAVVKAILTSDVFYSERAYRALVKSPAELVAGTARVLGAEVDGRGLPQVMSQMGQTLFNPPNVAGWPGGPAWLNSGTWLARLNFANRVVASLGPASMVEQLGRLGSPLHPNLVPLPTADARTPDDIVTRVVDLLLDGQVSDAQRKVLVDYVSTAHSGAGTALSRPWLDEGHRGALYLGLAMPEYHLA